MPWVRSGHVPYGGASPVSRQRDSPVGVDVEPKPHTQGRAPTYRVQGAVSHTVRLFRIGKAPPLSDAEAGSSSGPTGAHCREGIPKFRPRWGVGRGAPQGLSRKGSATAGSFWRERGGRYNSVVPSRSLSPGFAPRSFLHLNGCSSPVEFLVALLSSLGTLRATFRSRCRLSDCTRGRCAPAPAMAAT